jgi:hypothetical protein
MLIFVLQGVLQDFYWNRLKIAIGNLLHTLLRPCPIFIKNFREKEFYKMLVCLAGAVIKKLSAYVCTRMCGEHVQTYTVYLWIII